MLNITIIDCTFDNVELIQIVSQPHVTADGTVANNLIKIKDLTIKNCKTNRPLIRVESTDVFQKYDVHIENFYI